MRILMMEENFPVVIHCTHGKDRTGVIIMLLLLLCNVPTEVCTAFQSSFACVRVFMVHTMSSQQLQRSTVCSLLNPCAACMHVQRLALLLLAWVALTAVETCI